MHQLHETLGRLMHAAGACAWGLSSAADTSTTDLPLLDRWLDSGRHASMDYMRRNRGLFATPSAMLEGVKTIISAAFAYRPADQSDRHPLFADYARGADYHKALRRRLKPAATALQEMFPQSRTRICVDSAPVREKYFAIRCGIAAPLRNGLVAVPGAGSKVFLAEILWTEETAIPATEPIPSPCGACRRCQQACPGGAICGDGSVDARRCLSYLTIEHDGDLPEDIPYGRRVFGCDICQDVCPLNSGACATPLEEFRLSPALAATDIESLVALDSQGQAALFAGSAAKRAPLERLRRNISRIANRPADPEGDGGPQKCGF